jgi:hypothetical protein
MRELRLKPQARKVLRHLEKSSLSPMEAWGVYGIYRLAASIHEIRKQGWKILTTMHEDEAGKKYARYHLATQRAS